ncbi:MAG: polysaccharide deacetylase family protein [Verrucomicrobiota bacterium]
MNTRVLLSCLAAVVAFSGCEKVKKLVHFKSHEVVVAAPAPTATPTPAPTVAPAPVPRITANRNAGVIILCYHRFEEGINSPMVMKPADFEQQMQEIKDNGFTVISMQDFLAWRRDEKEIPVKSALITIDDGYVSAYEVGWPILKKFGYPFTMFVYINYVGTGGKAITWDQLAEMRDAGVEIGCHSYSHQNLKGKGPLFSKQAAEEVKRVGYDAWMRKEMIDSKKIIERQLGIKVATFAYPGGFYNAAAEAVIKEAGYEAAFITYGKRNGFASPAFDEIGRYGIEANKPKTFADAMAMVGGGVGPGMGEMYAAAPAETHSNAASLETEPADGATVSNPKPVIKANLSTMGEVDPASVEMRISGFGVVPAKFDAASKTVSFQPTTQPLRDKDYTVIISAKVGGKKAETRWTFNFDPSGAAVPAPAAGKAP